MYQYMLSGNLCIHQFLLSLDTYSLKQYKYLLYNNTKSSCIINYKILRAHVKVEALIQSFLFVFVTNLIKLAFSFTIT